MLATGWPIGLPKLIFTGRACSRGHVSTRQATGYYCTECEATRRLTPEAKATRRAYDLRPEVAERRREFDRARMATPEGREANRLYLRNYYARPEVKAAHREYMRENVATREAHKLKATPPWLTTDQHDEIKAIYQDAASREGQRHVDHIVPLRHPEVCGLHVPWNLQVLTSDDNLRKSNSFDGTLENESSRDTLALDVAAEYTGGVAGVAQGQSVSFPRKMSRVRIASPAPLPIL